MHTYQNTVLGNVVLGASTKFYITRDTIWEITQKRAGQLACSVTLDGLVKKLLKGGALLEKQLSVD